MELLELALKQSIDWSVGSGNGGKRKGAPAGEDKRRLSYDSLELMKNKLRDESHARAFISHFKIELNNLMGLKWSILNESLTSSAAASQDDANVEDADERDDDEDDDDDMDADDTTPSESSADRDDVADNSSRQQRRVMMKMRRKSSVQCTSGLYDISEQQTDADDDDFSQTVELVPSSSSSRPLSSLKSAASSAATTGEEETDCGYGSLSRGENTVTNGVQIAQELNEIKTRLIDLVEEIDSQVSAHLGLDEIDYYRRRRDALVCKLDALIEQLASGKCGAAVSSIEAARIRSQLTDAIGADVLPKHIQQSVSTMRKNKSEKHFPAASEYEEQVHVIDLIL